ncbi:MAG: cupin domain-containing protein, partial [Candidatus Rifleibacteriota bacterium]
RHPEGGYYSETYRSAGKIPASALHDAYAGERCCLTSIYFLLDVGEVSKFHRLRSDEIWYYHAGNGLIIHQIDAEGVYRQTILGPDTENGQSFQIVVPAGTWFGATIIGADQPSLAGCAVAPGFDFADFELANRESLLAVFPAHREIIVPLT